MTLRSEKRVSVARSKSSDYSRVADSFYQGGELAREFEYWNAAGVLIVHAAIAYADALTIASGGVKSRGPDHMAVADLLRQTAPLDEAGLKAVRHLERVIQEKNRVSYEGEIYRRKEVEDLWKHLERFRIWARAHLGS